MIMIHKYIAFFFSKCFQIVSLFSFITNFWYIQLVMFFFLLIYVSENNVEKFRSLSFSCQVYTPLSLAVV